MTPATWARTWTLRHASTSPMNSMVSSTLLGATVTTETSGGGGAGGASLPHASRKRLATIAVMTERIR